MRELISGRELARTLHIAQRRFPSLIAAKKLTPVGKLRNGGYIFDPLQVLGEVGALRTRKARATAASNAPAPAPAEGTP